jgi:uncharacterized protein Usg
VDGMTALRKQLSDHRLTTAEILYHMPDHPTLLQSYLWQDYDTAPHYPVLRRFLEFWQRELDGKLHSVRVATLPVIQAPALRHGALYLTIH